MSYATRVASEFVAWLTTARDAIKRKIGDDADDYPDIVKDTLFGVVDDVDLERARHALLQAYTHERACAEAQADLRRHYAAREDHHKARADAYKELLISSCEVLGDEKWKSSRGFGTVYSQAARDKVEVVDYAKLPKQYFREEASITAIQAALLAGKKVPGIEVVKGEDRPKTWIVRASATLKEAV